MSPNLILALFGFLLSSCTFNSRELNFKDPFFQGPVELPAGEPRIGDRNYIESYFAEAFQIQSSEIEDVVILRELTVKNGIHGGGCDPYGSTAQMGTDNKIAAEFPDQECGPKSFDPVNNPRSNAVRFALTTRLCEKMITTRPARFTALMVKIFPDWGQSPATDPKYLPDSESLTRAYRIFNRDSTPDPELLQALLEVVSLNQDIASKWKSILIPLCMNPANHMN